MSAVAIRAGLAALLAAGAARADTVVEAISFEPIASARYGLELEIQNFSKLPRRLLDVEVLIGGSERRAACRIVVPGLSITPAARARVAVAGPRTLAGCLPPGTTVHGTGRMASLALPARGAPATATRFERSIRIVPRFVDPAGRPIPRQLLAFRLGR